MLDSEKSTKEKEPTCKAALQDKQSAGALHNENRQPDLQEKPGKAALQPELKWVRIFTPVHIPKHLVEQIKSREFSIDDFYRHQEAACTYVDDTGNRAVSPLNHLYVLSDENYKVVGFLWFVIDDLCQTLIVQNFSIDRRFWGKGKAIELASKHVKEIVKNAKLKKVYWVTNRPTVFEKAGFTRAKDTIMEWDPEGEKDGKITIRGQQHQRTSEQFDTRTEVIS